MTTEPRKLGPNGPTLFPLALGCMGMSGMYGATSDRESIATIHAALDAGITLLDTGDYYGAGHNELLIGGVPGRLDPAVPIEDTVGAIADLVKVGYVRHIGLSEVGADTIRRAHAVHPISDLQIEYSVVSRGPEAKIFPVLSELGIGVTAYGVLSRGLLSGSKPAATGDFRAHLPRFSGENREQNQQLLDTLQRLAADNGVRSSQLAIAWVLAKGRNIVPVVGARTRVQLEESLGALKVKLSPADIARIEEAIPPSSVAGTRYGADQMRILDSER